MCSPTRVFCRDPRALGRIRCSNRKDFAGPKIDIAWRACLGHSSRPRLQKLLDSYRRLDSYLRVLIDTVFFFLVVEPRSPRPSPKPRSVHRETDCVSQITVVLKDLLTSGFPMCCTTRGSTSRRNFWMEQKKTRWDYNVRSGNTADRGPAPILGYGALSSVASAQQCRLVPALEQCVRENVRDGVLGV